jgi:hypothetical protein
MRDFWAYLRMRRRWWLAPLILVLLLVAVAMIGAQATGLGPLIYTFL